MALAFRERPFAFLVDRIVRTRRNVALRHLAQRRREVVGGVPDDRRALRRTSRRSRRGTLACRADADRSRYRGRQRNEQTQPHAAAGLSENPVHLLPPPWLRCTVRRDVIASRLPACA